MFREDRIIQLTIEDRTYLFVPLGIGLEGLDAVKDAVKVGLNDVTVTGEDIQWLRERQACPPGVVVLARADGTPRKVIDMLLWGKDYVEWDFLETSTWKNVRKDGPTHFLIRRWR